MAGLDACMPDRMVMQAGPAYVEAFMTVLRNVTKPDTVQYVLALLIKMVQGELRSFAACMKPMQLAASHERLPEQIIGA